MPPAQRVEAVLTKMGDPIGIDLALHYAGVSFDGLSDREKEEVNGVFSSPNVQSIEHEKFGIQYSVPLDRQEETLQRLGTTRKVVNGQITGIMWKDIIGEELK